MHLIIFIFQQYVADILAFSLRTFSPHSLRTQTLVRIERYLEDYKSQNKNKLAGNGQATEG